MSEALFWGSVAILLCTYFGYPAVVAAAAALRPRPRHTAATHPLVSLLIVAHNEAPRIRARLDNVLSLNYPLDHLEIVLASDGSTDATVDEARRYAPLGVSVLAFPDRRGKPAILNQVIPRLRGEIVVLADARQHFDPAVLRTVTAPFTDPRIGAVSGELILLPVSQAPSAVAQGVGFYWRYEKFIRRNESRLDSTVGATGAIYAIRRDLFDRIPEDTILDDVLIPMRIARQGHRVVFEPQARAYDTPAASSIEEFTRKVRTIGGNFQLLARERWLLDPFRNRLWLQTVLHKAGRLVSPLALLVAFGANGALAHQPPYHWVFAAQLTFYVAAAVGYLFRNARRGLPFTKIPYVFCLFSWATVVAFVRYVTGRQQVTWEKAT